MGTDLTLHRPSRIRAATYKPYRGSRPLRIVATVDLYKIREKFDHPVIAIAAIGSSDSALFTVNVKWQRHALTDDDRDHDRDQSRGFMATGTGRANLRSTAYGEEIQARADSRGFLRRVLDLLDRGEELLGEWRNAHPKARTACRLLNVVLGLRLCGVEVRISNPELRVLLAKHRAERMGTVVTEARVVYGDTTREYQIEDGPHAGRYAAADELPAWNVGQRCVVACNPALVTATRLAWVR